MSFFSCWTSSQEKINKNSLKKSNKSNKDYHNSKAQPSISIANKVLKYGIFF